MIGVTFIKSNWADVFVLIFKKIQISINFAGLMICMLTTELYYPSRFFCLMEALGWALLLFIFLINTLPPIVMGSLDTR